jgi:transposase-like protein
MDHADLVQSPAPVADSSPAREETPTAANSREREILNANDLSPQQRIALISMMRGRKLVEVAREANVTAMTLYRWRRNHPRFRATFASWQEDMQAAAQDRLWETAEGAIRAIDDSIVSGNAKTAIAVLKMLRIVPSSDGRCNSAPRQSAKESANASDTK